MNKLLIFSNSTSGHNIEYLVYLYQRIITNKIPTIFVTLAPITKWSLLKDNEHVQFVQLESQIDHNEKINTATEIDKICIRENVHHVLFMHLDIVLIPIFLKINSTCQISTIYFEHFVRYHLIWDWRFWARGLRYITPIALNKKVKNIFILNDKPGTKRLNAIYPRLSKFKLLIDPLDLNLISDTNNLEINLRTKYHINDDNTILTCIGYLDKRKNTSGIVQSLKFISDSDATKITLMIFGEADPQEDMNIRNAINELNSLDKGLQIIYQNKKVSYKQFNDILFQSDIIAMPYIGHVGSSGILGNAVKYKKIVIAAHDGLVNALVKKYKLGPTVNPYKHKEIAQAITYCMHHKSENHMIGAKKYVDDFNPTALTFSKQIIDSIIS